MFPFSRALVAAALLSIASAAQSAGLLYECDITDRRRDVDWIAETYVVVIDADGQVSVIDNIILIYNEAPVRPRFVSRRGDRLRINYTLRVIDAARVQWPMSYTAVLDNAARTITLRARPTQGGSVSWRGKGTCTTRTR
jgi:hypothetical protein